jgi:hypothetical protein
MINSRTVPLTATLAKCAFLWLVSDAGYYLLLPEFGIEPNYNESPISVALYYGLWANITAVTFRRWYSSGSRYAKWPWFETRMLSYFVWSLALIGPQLFAVFVLPSLPPIGWTESWNPPEIRVATAWYFLPKSLEIVFQQLLLVALVLAFAVGRYTIGKIMAFSAAVFGGAHALLVFTDVPLGFVARYMISAAAFGLMFPYFILHVRNGLAYSYMIHWLYYLATITMPHIFWHPGK